MTSNELGLAILGFVDVKIAFAVSIVATLALSLWKYIRFGAWPTYRAAIATGFSILSLFSGIGFACVLILTEPPAIEKLSQDTRVGMALICLLSLAYLCAGEIRATFVSISREPPAEPKK